MAIEQALHSNLAIPPGEFLAEVIEDLGMTKADLANRLDRPATKLSAIFRGKKAITPHMALLLEKVVGVRAHVWMGLESEYRLALARQSQEAEVDRLKAEAPLVKKFCYPELAKQGYVEDTSTRTERVSELQRFLGVTSLRNIKDINRYRAAFRQGRPAKGAASSEALAVFLRIAEIKGRCIDCAPFNAARLRGLLPYIRGLTTKSPKVFQPKLTKALAGAGVAFVVCRHLPKTRAHGAAFWLGKDKAVVATTIRGKMADIFWFSLFHELGHVLLHGRQKTFIEGGAAQADKKQEREADAFAANTLVPAADWGAFLESGRPALASIQRFAKQQGIAPGIVVGRLQHEKRLRPEVGNDLKQKLEWAGG